MITLNYISSVTVDKAAHADELQAIHSVSVSRNSALSITGLLIASPCYFAQILEGSDEHVDAVMASIERDGRHRDIVIVRRKAIKARRFKTWQMALYDSVTFGATTVDPLLAAVHSQKDPKAIQRFDRFVSAVAMDDAVIKR